MVGINDETQMFIKVLSGQSLGNEYLLPKAKMIIGSSSSKSDLCFPDDRLMSDNHAQIIYEEGQYWLEDLGSTGGTFINGRKLDRKERLQNGNKFQLGETRFEFKKSASKKFRSEKDIMIGEKPEGSLNI